jgi:two-component system chemotaxis sensor kinase CheA
VAEVFATVSPDKRSIVEGFGAVPIDNRSIPVEQYLATYTQGKGFDIVYDTVGGATLDASFQAVKRYTGHALSCLGWDSHSLAPLSFRGATYSGVFTLLPLITGEGRAHHGQILAQAATFAEAGKHRPLLNERRFSTADIDAAHALVESGAWEKWSLPASLLQPTCPESFSQAATLKANIAAADVVYGAAMDLEILQDYLIESKELLQNAQHDLLRLEADPSNDSALASIFRAFHTIKGGAAFLDATHLVSWAHDLEDLLDKLRVHSLPVTSARIDAILGGIDILSLMLLELAEEEVPGPGPAELGRTIKMLAGAEPELEPPAGNASAIADAEAAQVQPAAAAAPPRSIPSEEYIPAPEGGASVPASPPRSAPRSAEAVENSLRVDADRLDAVMNQVGELVLLRNRLTSAVGGLGKEDENMSRIAREMDLRVSDLQNTVMRLRMQPCRRLFQQLPRVVRDLSRQLKKEVRLEIIGEDVEIDKTVVDALSGPMTHLVRNSLDHGIELPEVRRGANKPPTALLRLAAIHLGDKVRIEVSDDGHGIDRRAIVQKAIEKEVVTAEQAARLSEQEALELIFRPGFSTKDYATDLSGRGVGMDVVKETTDKLRGRLSIDSTLGQGTRVAMEFPLTLAVLPVLYLRVRQDVYALPISAIDSLTDLEEQRVHRLAGRVTYRVDGTETVPMVDLGAVLQDRPLRLGAESVEGVLTERGLFVVSEVLGNEDSVVKPIDFLAGPSLYQGATISGRGSVVLILDAVALSAAASAALEGGR